MDCDELEDSKLHEAVRYGDIDDVRHALKDGDNPNQIGIYQWNPLHEASCNGDKDIVKLLLKYNGDANKPDMLRGSTAVHYAASNGHAAVLKLLLHAGGWYNIKNNDGETCLDVADGWECQKQLREQRDKQLILPCKDSIKENLIQDTRLNDSNNNNESAFSDATSINSASALSELDNISVDTQSSSSSRPHSRAWGPDRVLGMRDLQLGHVQLSFEYNVNKKTFKIRVWQVTDILLPPPDTSMISSVYVKSFLQPDKKKETKRKTEEVKTEQIDFKEIRKKGQEHIVNFQPACFRFKKALEYENITKEILESRFVEIEICIVQRYTRKSFVVATWNMPMKLTAKKLVKEKFPLKPMLSTSLPENMKVYAASEMDVSFTRNYHSNPNLRRTSSRSSSSWATPYDEKRAVSDTDLHKVSVDPINRKKNPSIEISLPDDDEEEDLEHALQQITIMEQREGRQKKRQKQVEFTSLHMPDTNADYEDEDGLDIHIQEPLRMAEVQIHVPNIKHGDDDYDNGDITTSRKTGKKQSSFLGSKAKAKAALKEKANRPLKAGPKFKTTQDVDEEASIGGHSGFRPCDPEWDYYSDPLSFSHDNNGVVTVDIEAPAGQVILPMATSFDGIAETHTSGTRSGRRSTGEGRKLRSKAAAGNK